jgi:hypothetical protein
VPSRKPRGTHTDPSQQLVDDVVNHYLTSGDFNGYDWSYTSQLPDQTPEILKAMVRPLIAAGRLTIRTDAQFAFVKRMPDEPVEDQLRRLDESNMQLLRLYPSVAEMKGRVGNKFRGRPFTKELARGYAQLEPRFFEPLVLEQYRNDPRYWCRFSDVSGHISAHEEGHSRDSDRVFLQTFGFAYDDDDNRAVAVYLRYLSDFSPEHQQIWKARELSGEYWLHPDYVCGSLYGVFPDHIQILDAILFEQKAINDIARLMGRPPVFKQEFSDGRPDGLTFLLRPTAREYANFIHVLDKILSENIDTAFFGTEVALTDEVKREAGRIEVKRKGTLRVFEDWLRQHFRPRGDGDVITAVFKPLKLVRKLRQKPAHALHPDKYDRSLWKQQRDLIVSIYRSLQAIRTAFQRHPTAAHYKLDHALASEKIRPY